MTGEIASDGTGISRKFSCPAMSLRIIINADDLGLCQEANEAIFKCFESGLVTSTTALSNGPAMSAAAIKSLQLFRNCSAGIHLNLTEFEPLCKHSCRDLASILDENGCFNGNSIREVRIDRPLLQEVFHEWCSQIENLS